MKIQVIDLEHLIGIWRAQMQRAALLDLEQKVTFWHKF